jgi:hypothetical protein
MESKVPNCGRGEVMLQLLAAVISTALFGCGGRVYLDSWQPDPLEDGQGLPRAVSEAIAVRASDLPHIEAAGGRFLGHHQARKGWARRAGSTGGTHFLYVEDSAPSSADCVSFRGAPFCGSPGERRYSRVAVFRVTSTRWHELPFHLIPPRSVVRTGTRASAWRDNCRVHNSYGRVNCSRRVRVVQR